MTRLRHDQDCLNGSDCAPATPRRPRLARYGGLCARCYMAAAPAIKATADLLDRLDMPAGFVPFAAHRETVRDTLEALWVAPAYGEA